MLTPWRSSKAGNQLKRTFDKVMEQFGHNVLYRRYSIGDKSKYYDESTGDGNGGPKWVFTDEVIKVRHDPMSVRGAVGITVQKSKMFVKSNVKPKRGDVIIELDLDDSKDKYSETDLYHAQHIEAFEIEEVDIKRGLKGRIEYYLVQVVPHLGDY
ncbi:hypothetical protein H8D85_02605 [bacterium]|nr:hypothetical protein [bacterium]